MKKILVKSLLTLGILSVGFFSTGAAAFAGYPPQHGIEAADTVINPYGYPPQH
ncbi:hypothetical protein [Cytobacillus praedii]|uniref:hypothetical protein n=1 Tax=Cytobacillus praedii TaxID=1742358 RepID=UPI003AF80A57